MSLAPLLAAAPEIQVHAFAAMAAFLLGAVQLAAPKGTLPHRTLGWVWVALMLVISASSFLIHGMRLWGPWSPIHLLSVFAPIMLVLGVVAARSAPGARPQDHDDLDLCRCPDPGGAVHAGARPAYARRPVRLLKKPQKARSGEAVFQSLRAAGFAAPAGCIDGPLSP